MMSGPADAAAWASARSSASVGIGDRRGGTAGDGAPTRGQLSGGQRTIGVRYGRGDAA